MTIEMQTAESGESAAASIEKDLRRAIIELELLPGSRLSEQEIATRLGVSRQPVREEHDEAFHFAVAQGAGVSIAWIAIADMKTHMDRVCNMTLQSEADMRRRVREHRAIMTAIDEHDVEGAKRAMADHLGSILDDLPELETRHASLFI